MLDMPYVLGMTHDERKKRGERATFERYCKSQDLTIVPGSLYQPEPPAPDLLATIDGYGEQAYELVNLRDSDGQRRYQLMPESSDLVHPNSVRPVRGACTGWILRN